jgi:hypothetical protein
MRDSHSEPAPGSSHTGDVTTFPGAGPVDPSLPSEHPVCLETFTIPPAALEVARQREADDERLGRQEPASPEIISSEPPPPEFLSLGSPSPDFFTSSSPSLPMISSSFLVPDDTSDDTQEADGPGPESAWRGRRRRYKLLLLLVMVFGILLIIAAAVSRSIRSASSLSEVPEQPLGEASSAPSAVAPSAAEPTAAAPSAAEPTAAAPSAAEPTVAAPSAAEPARVPLQEPATQPPTEPAVSAKGAVKRIPVPRRPENPPKAREFLYDSAYPQAPR